MGCPTSLKSYRKPLVGKPNTQQERPLTKLCGDLGMGQSGHRCRWVLYGRILFVGGGGKKEDE